MIRWEVSKKYQSVEKIREAWLDIDSCKNTRRPSKEILYEAEYGDLKGFKKE
jgi:hypothetical protein